MPTLGERIAAAAQALANASESPRLDAGLLLAHALQISHSQLLARLHQSTDVPGFDTFIKRRLAFEPVAHILGEWGFFSLTLEVSPPLFVPRPETEHLVEAVLEFVGDRQARVLELCAGSGCVAVAIAHNAPQCRVTAVDINPDAITVTQRNATRYGLTERIEVKQSDLFSALADDVEPFDVVCANPPYVEEAAWPALSPSIRMHEDPRALLAGKDGLDVIRRIVPGALDFLRPGGLLALEIGMGQYEAVRRILLDCRYEDIGFRKDLAGIMRIAQARAPGT